MDRSIQKGAPPAREEERHDDIPDAESDREDSSADDYDAQGDYFKETREIIQEFKIIAEDELRSMALQYDIPSASAGGPAKARDLARLTRTGWYPVGNARHASEIEEVLGTGLDFPDIQHVINFDMPSEIENYVHRIGRTGRCGKTGVATTFINKTVEPSALLDLKHLLVEAKQRVPPVLQVLDEPEERGEGCAFCGGLGHTILDCPKRDKDARRLNANRRDMLSGTGGPGGDW